ncbi:MAG: BatA and WFA domain-containing protein [Clostridia bacterium]|nr:BatA and WFA domain-containing protein [Clostridia bacterium]
MKFYYPLGLIGLIGVPILILIYIIKSKYTEQTIASTYLWDLSERFLRKRKPISKLTGIITLILQILAIIIVSFLIAHPVFTIPNSANDYYFILDGSASMNMNADGVSRFDKAQSEITKRINDSRSGSSYSLVFVGDTSDVIFEGVTDKTQAKIYLRDLEAGWSETDCSSAVALAQDYFNGNPSADIFIMTDKEYDVNENVTLVNVAGDEKNFVLFDAQQTRNIDGSVTVTGKVVSYTSEESVTVELYALEKMDAEPVKIKEVPVAVSIGEAAEFQLRATSEDFAAQDLMSFAALQLRIADGDALLEDNLIMLYNEANKETRKVLIVRGTNNNGDGASAEVKYFESAFSNTDQVTFETITSKDYEEKKYSEQEVGVYLFYGWAPDKLPTNASIWLVNVENVGGTGARISYSGDREAEAESGLGSYFSPKFTKKTSTQINMITQGLSFKKGREPDIAIHRYIKYDFPKNFTPILSVGVDDVISIGQNDNHDREVVFAFGIGQSNFGVMDDFPILVKNLLSYSLPSLIEETTYVCGDILPVNVISGCENIVVTTPSQKSVTLDTFEKDVCEFQLSETGTYKITATIAGNAEDTVLYIYAYVPETESRPDDGKVILVSGEKEENYSDGYYDKLLAFFIVIAVVLLADWGIYCYEQYQLR